MMRGVLMLAVVGAALACTPPSTPDKPGWQVVAEGTQVGGPILSAWGAGGNHLILVGGPVGNGSESLVYRWDGSTVSRLHPGGTETFWWTSGTSPNDVWMVGEHGRITHFDGTNFQDHTRPVDATLWGVIAFAANDVWAVGGMPGRGSAMPNDLVFHFDGTSWARETLPGEARNTALLKTWGTSSNDLYVVGERATIWHRTAAGWTLESALDNPPLATGTLFSVHGCSGDDVYAAGGESLLHRTNGRWSKVALTNATFINGVSCGPGRVVLAGFGGFKMRILDSGTVDESDSRPFADLHGVWNDSEGGSWVVGGDWTSHATNGATREGAIARWGNSKIGATFQP